ncbi:MAG: hypothetical protein MJY94_09690 [Bacteroidales bacterium]|nr:hypothetical protein [Bacteroidales bacterium]
MSKHLRRIILAFVLVLLCVPAFSQKKEKQDSLVRLMSAKSVRLLQIDGVSYREAIEANFLHNDTYLICDTALWNVGTNIIDANGNVKILQEETQLTSDKLTYRVDDNLAEFRGSLVQLQDKDKNTLRTRYLDYNTKDSVAVFSHGASMRDKDGQIIESRDGTYESALKTFIFENQVNMYTDSVFIKTSRLEYQADSSLATFSGGLDAWKGKNMLSSKHGWYDKRAENFLFREDVHGLSPTQEIWCDSLYYWRALEDVKMIGHVQVTDTTREVSAMAEVMFYQDSLSRITMERDAAIAAASESQGKKDTIYVSADRIVYNDIQKHLIPESVMADSEKRVKELSVDPVSEYRRKAAKDASSSEGSSSQSPLPTSAPPSRPAAQLPDSLSTRTAVPDSLLADKSVLDSLSTEVAVEPQLDTTKIGFLSAKGRVKVFRSDMQAVCDSLEYSDLDSLARMYIDPIVWNEENRQYRSDSLTVIIKDKKMDRASLMSNAFIVIQEDSVCYDQIKSAEIMAYFDGETALRRFDALGGANAIFYLQENDVFATVNKVESKMLSAKFTDGEIDTIYYFDSPQNDAYPVVQFPKAEREMKGFSWLPELRPRGKSDVTSHVLRASQRKKYEEIMRPSFYYTNQYFPGHIGKIFTELARVDSLRAARRNAEPEVLVDSTATISPLDSLSAAIPELRDSLGVVTDSLAVAADSLGVLGSVADSLGIAGNAVSDSLAVETSLDPKAIKRAEQERKRAEAERKRQERMDRREERWAELDARDAIKAARDQAKATEKRRQATYRALIRLEKRAAKEQKQLDRYVERYRKKALRKKPSALLGE